MQKSAKRFREVCTPLEYQIPLVFVSILSRRHYCNAIIASLGQYEYIEQITKPDWNQEGRKAALTVALQRFYSC